MLRSLAIAIKHLMMGCFKSFSGINMLLRKFLGWENCSPDDYRYCYNEFGGNFSSNPDALHYVHQKTSIKHQYLMHTKHGKADAAICVWNGKYIANGSTELLSKINPNILVAEDELIMPLSPSFKGFIPFKAKLLSPIQPGKVLNSSFNLNAKREIAIFKGIEKFSKKTQDTMRRKIKKFIDAGGEVVDNENLTAEDLTKIYAVLFYMRRQEKISIHEHVEFIKKFRRNIFGKLLFINEKPCAFMLNIKNETNKLMAIDFINIARDKVYDKLSIGNILMWINALEAEKQRNGKELRFSFGRPTSKYKENMCVNQKVGRIFSL